VHALDPDADGKLLWERSINKGGPSGGILWASAVDGDRIYAASAYPDPKNPEASGGLTALDLGSRGVVWRVYPPPCGERKPCKPAQSAAVTAIPGVVSSATMDGQLRAYSASEGRVIWEYNAVQDYRTVNGVKANGGSVSNGRSDDRERNVVHQFRLLSPWRDYPRQRSASFRRGVSRDSVLCWGFKEPRRSHSDWMCGLRTVANISLRTPRLTEDRGVVN